MQRKLHVNFFVGIVRVLRNSVDTQIVTKILQFINYIPYVKPEFNLIFAAPNKNSHTVCNLKILQNSLFYYH
jgi:hypothetical protein